MEDLKQILTKHRMRKVEPSTNIKELGKKKHATTSEIPDLFFDDILVRFRLNRIEILVLMYLYRQVWCRPNLNQEHGITPDISMKRLERSLSIEHQESARAFQNLESLQLIETIRVGQYFVRKYFTEENDKTHGQTYDNFL